MEQYKKISGISLRTCCTVYIILMLLLLYAKGLSAWAYRIESARLGGYLETINRYTNLELLRSIRPFLRQVKTLPPEDIIVNQITGNVLIFIPAGIFLPLYIKKQRRLRRFLLTSLLLILFIESSQVLTLLGSFDVDDILLNLIGCLTGWLFFSVLHGFLRLFRRH